MADPTVSDFEALFPEFTGVSDIQFYLDDSIAELSRDNWSTGFNKAVLYYSAHQLALSQNRQAQTNTTAAGLVVTPGSTGAITSASDGNLSVSYVASSAASSGNENASWLQSTSYGQRYAALKRQHLPWGRLVGRGTSTNVSTC